MKKLLLFSGILFAFFAMQAQTILIQDNFDSYTVGDKLGVVNTAFSTWSAAPGTAEDGTISNEQAASPSNSLKVAPGNDIILPLGNLTTGVYVIEFDYYVPSTGAGAYFNVLHSFAGSSSQWALECYFRNDGTGYLMAGTALAGDLPITYPSNQFFHVYLKIDLTGDEAMLKINDAIINTWPFHYNANNINGINQLGAVNFFAGAPVGDGTYYVDNLSITTTEIIVTCLTPTNLMVTSISSHSALATWTNDDNVTSWQVEYKLASSEIWISASANTNSYSLTGLQTNAIYEVRVKAICATNESDFTAAVPFTTLGSGIEESDLVQCVELFPNPTTSVIELKIKSDQIHIQECRIYDIYGKLMRVLPITAENHTIDVTDFSSGVYFVLLDSERGFISKKFVKK